MPSRLSVTVFGLLMLIGAAAFLIADPAVTTLESTLVYVSTAVTGFACALLALFGPTGERPERGEKTTRIHFACAVAASRLLPILFAAWVAFMGTCIVVMSFYKQAKQILADCDAPMSLACMSAEVVTTFVDLPLAWVNGGLIALIFGAAYGAAQSEGKDNGSRADA